MAYLRILVTGILLTVSLLSLHAQAPAIGVSVEDEFKVTAIPEQWKNESAVIIGQRTEYLFTRPGSSKSTAAIVRISEYVHKRIRLQDKNALEKFSTFYYVTMGRDGKAEYKIVKASGKEEAVDMKTAIEEDSEVPDIYKPIFYKLAIKSMKIAIPNLEIGDIIDYTIRSTFDWDMKSDGIQFTPFIFSLSNSYPTLYQQYRFTMANGMKVKYRNYNGAPTLKFDNKASVYGDRESYLSYYFMDKNREKSSEDRWNFEFRNTPTVKFRVVLLADNDPESKGLGEATVDRAGIDPAAMYRYFGGAAAYPTTTVNSLVGYTTEYISKKRRDGLLKTNDEVIKETYYCLRKVFLEMYYKGPVRSELEKYMTGKKLYKKVLAQQKKEEEKKEERQDEIRINSITFATALRMALAAQQIPAELQVYMPRKLGNWRDAIFMEELDFVLKVKLKGKAYFLEAFNNFDAFGTPYSYLEGTEGYSIGYDAPDRYYRTPIPATGMQDNVEREEYAIRFTDAMDLTIAEKTSSYLGNDKSSRIGPANLERSYLSYDFSKYFSEPKTNSSESKRKKDKEEPVVAVSATTTDALKYEDPDKEEHVRERKEIFEKMIRNDLDLEKYDNFELIRDGRFGDTAWLQYRENFTVNKLLSKAGKNYLFDVGKLIGGQIKLETHELQGRKVDIWLPYARTIQNTIAIQLPAGYTADGLQELVMNVDNESGSFISTAKLEGDKILITTTKLYKKNFDKKEAWPNYIAFLEAAYKFSQSKLVLKKK
ncbi:MAG TPA: DUF3857 domain-containing protein [Chitinophagaceae bacterium]|nr:DUF3857 domain-containing protein [Chitinophagaceae bacterium]